MDRIYYFRLAGEKAKKELPIFRIELQNYEMFYLQMCETVKKEELVNIQAYMAKGIQRLNPGDKQEHMRAYLVYNSAFEKWLRRYQLKNQWEKLWDTSQYNEYREAHNLALLLKQIESMPRPKRLVILGEAPGMSDWIGSVARSMKEVTFYSRTVPRGFVQAREILLEEYGLLTAWKPHLQPEEEAPVLVLDYCGEEKIYIWGVAPGSVWIDMTSMEERRHAIVDRETGIYYVSLKSIWEEEMSQTLDTANKIKYNT